MRKGLRFLPTGIFLAILIILTVFGGYIRKLTTVQVQVSPVEAGYLEYRGTFSYVGQEDDRIVYSGPAEFGNHFSWNVCASYGEEPLDWKVLSVTCDDGECMVELLFDGKKEYDQINLQAQSNYKKVLVPNSAVLENMVFRVVEQETTWGKKCILIATNISPGERDMDNTEVLVGLYHGDKVVTCNTPELYEGQIVVIE